MQLSWSSQGWRQRSWSLKKILSHLSWSRHICVRKNPWVQEKAANKCQNLYCLGFTLFRLRKQSWDLELQQTQEVIFFAYIRNCVLLAEVILENGFIQKKKDVLLYTSLVCCKSENKTTIMPSFSKHDITMGSSPPFILKWSTYLFNFF